MLVGRQIALVAAMPIVHQRPAGTGGRHHWSRVA